MNIYPNNRTPISIVGAARTPSGCFKGSLRSLSATELGAAAIKGALFKAGINPDQVNEVIMGCVLPAGLGQAPARHAALKAGLPTSAGCTTINKVCGSGMKATMLAHDLIVAQGKGIFVAGGMESMSNAPYLVAPGTELPINSKDAMKHHMFFDGLQDAETGRSMGIYAQDLADEKGYSRARMDAFASESLSRAKRAVTNGDFKEEIIPLTTTTEQGSLTIVDDEQPALAQLEKIPHLKPAFKENGSITAANSSSISDGASALVLMDETTMLEQNITPLAHIIGHATHAQHPSLFSTAPISAIENLLAKIGWHKDEVDLWEINEAFALVALLAIDALKLDPAKVNVRGGACALGHPIGSSGCRIIVSLIYALRQLGGKRGIASLCIGGGEATAIAIEIP